MTASQTLPATTPAPSSATPEWWRSAVTYQLYIRSFADADGDGIGDVEGIRSRLPYLAALGVDAIWINPWYPSPQADAGYDVSDFRDVEPLFGDLEAGQRLIDEAHAHGLKVLLDIVPNHTSDEHAWFLAALAAGPGSPERARYLFRDGRGENGELAPNDWSSVFGGSAWERVTEADGSPGQWYLHLFDVKQPDLDWENPEVWAEFRSVLRFWFDRGVDGFRIDVAHGLVKDPALPDLNNTEEVLLGGADREDHPHWDLPGVHAIWRDWREVADSYDPPKVFVAEAWVSSPERLAAYLRPDELHTAFDFDVVRAAWDAAELRSTIAASLATTRDVGAPVTWVLSNHDIDRHVTRYGRPQDQRGKDPVHGFDGGPIDVALGTRRARAVILLELALPGSVYLYQGEELGLEEVVDLPGELREDPIYARTGGKEPGRDGCRVPVPWTRDGASLGFGPGGSWLPQPAHWADLSVQAQDGDPASMLTLYRTALSLRHELGALGPAGPREITWLAAPEGVLAFTRGDGFTCVLVTDGAPVDPASLGTGEVVVSSVPLVDGLIPADASAWIVSR